MKLLKLRKRDEIKGIKAKRRQKRKETLELKKYKRTQEYQEELKRQQFNYTPEYWHYFLLDKLKVSSYESTNDYYKCYLSQYKKDGFRFKLNRFYGFNFSTLFLGPIFYMYNGLFLGLFWTFLLTVVFVNFTTIYTPFIYEYFNMIFVGNIVSAIFANYFMVLKFENNLKTSIKYSNNEQKILEYTYNRSDKFKFFNIIMMIPYCFFLFYLIGYLTNPNMMLHPIDSFNNINHEMAKEFDWLIKNQNSQLQTK